VVLIHRIGVKKKALANASAFSKMVVGGWD
jgi:hypothetical protein